METIIVMNDITIHINQLAIHGGQQVFREDSGGAGGEEESSPASSTPWKDNPDLTLTLPFEG
eukprot:3080059-Ditylum_brightwellii.AAC.1